MNKLIKSFKTVSVYLNVQILNGILIIMKIYVITKHIVVKIQIYINMYHILILNNALINVNKIKNFI